MKTWHDRHTALFGAKIPADMATAWTAVWAAKGFTDEILSQAVLGLAMLEIEKRPEWPLEHVEAVERLSGQILIDRALAGLLGPLELKLATKLAEQNAKSSMEAAKKKCVGFAEWHPEKGLPEARLAHQAKAVLESLKKRNSAAALGVKAEASTNAEAVAKVREISSLIGRSIS